MEENEDEMIMDNIDECLNDEMKVVSYKWLSLSLSLHATKAIQLLEQYVNKKEDKLDIIYFVGGKKENGLGMTFKYKLVKKDSLDDVKKSFDDVTTCHIYSIQKSQIRDTDVLYASDLDIVKEHLSEINKYSAIECDSLRDLSETKEKRTDHDHVPVINGFHDENVKKAEQDEPKVEKVSPVVPTHSGNNKGKQKAKKETTTLSFFGKPSSKKREDSAKLDQVVEVPSKTEAKSSAVPSVKSNVEKQGIAGAFSKSKKKDPPKQADSSKITASEDKTIDIEMEEEDSAKLGKVVEVPPKTEKSLAVPSDTKIDVGKKGIAGAFSKGKKNDPQKQAEDEGIGIEMEEEDSHSKKEESVSKRKKKKEDERKEKKNRSDDLASPEKKDSVKMDKKGDMTEVKKRKDGISKEEESKKAEKRKAVIDSSSEDDDFEKFLTKSKDPSYKSPEKKKVNKAKTEVIESSEGEEVIQPTPEPVEKKRKRRKIEKGEVKKKKENENVKERGSNLKFENDKKQEYASKADESSNVKRRGRRTVMKSKQYLDEDGFMVTKKEYESESFSEESDTEISEEKMKTLSPEKKKEVEKKKVIVDLEKKTKVHLSKPKKQASMMNFFTKK